SLAISPKAPFNVLAATSSGVLVSRDSGASWSTASGFGFFNTLVPDPADPAIVYAAAGSSCYRSTNGGTSWTATRVGPVNVVNALAIDPKAPATLYAGTSGGVYKSTNGGSTWALAGSDTGAARSVVLHPQNSS